MVYAEAVEDQLPKLKQHYPHDRSMLLQLLCEVWVGNLETYKKYKVLPAIVSLLEVPTVGYEVVGLVFGMIKRLLGNSLVMRADLQNKKLSLRALGLKEAAS